MLHTLDEVIDGWLHYKSYHFGLTDVEPEPGTPDFTDLPLWRDVTADWMRDLVFSHPEVIEKMMSYSMLRNDIRYIFKNAAFDIMLETVAAFHAEHSMKLSDVTGNRHKGYVSPRTKGLLDQPQPDHGR